MNDSNNVRDTLVNNLISLRRSNGLTQLEFGEKINYSDKTISKWEKGDSCPNIEAVYRIAQFYGITVDELLSENVHTESHTAEIKHKKYGKLIISLLAIIAVWFIATVVFIFEILMKIRNPWLVFVHAAPCTAIVILVFNTMWGKPRLNYLILSVALWLLLTSIFLNWLKYIKILWVIYLVGIPIQLAIILWSQLTRKRPKQKIN